MRSFGFWAHSPLSVRHGAEHTGKGHPSVVDHVELDWGGREEALRLLEAGTALVSYLSSARCRICGEFVGNCDMTLDRNNPQIFLSTSIISFLKSSNSFLDMTISKS